jgi:hypothetical protein
MAKVKVKYVGKGLYSRGVDFDPVVNDGLYEIDKEDADYLIATFPEQFVLIEPVKETKKAETKKRAPKKEEAKKED